MARPKDGVAIRPEQLERDKARNEPIGIGSMPPPPDAQLHPGRSKDYVRSA